VVERGSAIDTTGTQNQKTQRIPEGCQMLCHENLIAPDFWHPSGMRYIFPPFPGGVARRASLNHRLQSGKPPACMTMLPCPEKNPD